MALCPHCHEILNFWNVKAECPKCGINIPNYDWEGRLNEDAENAKAAWVKFRKFTENFKSALFGSKLRIIRFICTFLPLIALVLPLAKYSLSLPFVTITDSNLTLLNFTLNTLLELNFKTLFGIVSGNILGTPVLLLLLAVLCLYSAVVFGVLNFLFVLIKAPSLKAGTNVVLCILSDICFILPGIFFLISTNTVSVTTAPIIGGSLQFGLFVGIILFTLNVILNIMVNKSMKKQKAEQLTADGENI